MDNKEYTQEAKVTTPLPTREGQGGGSVALTVMKVGGAVVEDPASLSRFISDFVAIPGPKVLVHGGGRSATQLATRLGIETRMVEGRRITDDEMLRVVTMVYGGLVNKNIVAQLQAAGVCALGLTGADMDIIRSHKRGKTQHHQRLSPLTPSLVARGSSHQLTENKKQDAQSHSAPLPTREGQGESLEFFWGWVGDVDRADGNRLASLIREGIVPVIAPLTHDGKGHLLNTNADTMAQTVACALAPFYSVTLHFAFEKRGVLRNPDDPESFIPHITEADFQRLRAEGIVSGGMLPKLENAFEAIRQGVHQVEIGETILSM